MELKWLEDFVSLAETRSFSRSAELRHITQPAFSRRIQALEAWLGTELIDRSVYPTRLDASRSGLLRAGARDALAVPRGTRAVARADGGAAGDHRLRGSAHAVADLFPALAAAYRSAAWARSTRVCAR